MYLYIVENKYEEVEEKEVAEQQAVVAGRSLARLPILFRVFF